MTHEQDQIPRRQGDDGYFYEIRSWEVASKDGTKYEISLISSQWDPLPDGEPAIKVQLDIGGGKLKGQGMKGTDLVLSKEKILPARRE